jgi:hypothetical protein
MRTRRRSSKFGKNNRIKSKSVIRKRSKSVTRKRSTNKKSRSGSKYKQRKQHNKRGGSCEILNEKTNRIICGIYARALCMYKNFTSSSKYTKYECLPDIQKLYYIVQYGDRHVKYQDPAFEQGLADYEKNCAINTTGPLRNPTLKQFIADHEGYVNNIMEHELKRSDAFNENMYKKIVPHRNEIINLFSEYYEKGLWNNIDNRVLPEIIRLHAIAFRVCKDHLLDVKSIKYDNVEHLLNRIKALTEYVYKV